MKKFLVFLWVLVMITGLAAAEGIGFTAGLEAVIYDINKPNEKEDAEPYIQANIIYENAFIDEALDLYVELAYAIGLTKDEYDDKNPQELYFDIMAGYNIGLGDSSILTVILENENFMLLSQDEDNAAGILRPGVRFNQSLDAGDIYIQADVPFAYMYFGLDSFMGLDITAGWESEFGLGLSVTGHMLFSDVWGDDSNGFTGLSLAASYETGPFYMELLATIPVKEEVAYTYFDSTMMSLIEGISITPLFKFTVMPGLKIYASCRFDQINVEGVDMGISPGIGITFSF
ncbi:MAG: hypothetical protein FWD40_09220 [Treponema sp.]|nr:hypothetical protein [Treponema sp.]